MSQDEFVNRSAGFFCNFTRTAAQYNGIYLYFDVKQFTGTSMYWVGPYVMLALRYMFPNANIVYVDCDAMVFWEVFLARIFFEHTLDEDTFVAAGDCASNINAGFFCILHKNSRAAYFKMHLFNDHATPWEKVFNDCGKIVEEMLQHHWTPEWADGGSFTFDSCMFADNHNIFGSTNLASLRVSNVNEMLIFWVHILWRFASLHWGSSQQPFAEPALKFSEPCK